MEKNKRISKGLSVRVKAVKITLEFKLFICIITTQLKSFCLKVKLGKDKVTMRETLLFD